MEKKATTTLPAGRQEKKSIAKPAAVAVPKAPKKALGKYFFAVVRRKTSTVRIKLFPEGTGEITVNERPFAAYFPTFGLQKSVMDPLTSLGLEKKINVKVIASGGGVASQAKAV